MAPTANGYEELKKYIPAEKDVHEFVQEQVGGVFSAILENSGVFKTGEDGRNAFLRFIGAVNGK